jgi:hypothetical protein
MWRRSANRPVFPFDLGRGVEGGGREKALQRRTLSGCAELSALANRHIGPDITLDGLGPPGIGRLLESSWIGKLVAGGIDGGRWTSRQIVGGHIDDQPKDGGAGPGSPPPDPAGNFRNNSPAARAWPPHHLDCCLELPRNAGLERRRVGGAAFGPRLGSRRRSEPRILANGA